MLLIHFSTMKIVTLVVMKMVQKTLRVMMQYRAAIVQNSMVKKLGEGLDGSSFVAVQKWLHNFEQLNDMSVEQRDDVIGRHISDNEEFDDAPESAHVKRTAQESFSPEAFMLRRSMPWAEEMNAGLVFVAFGKIIRCL